MATVGVRILDSEYQVRCDEEQVEDLQASAKDLDGRMRQIRSAGQIHAVDRLAILAALNIAHDNRQLRRRLARAEHGASALAARVDEAIATHRPDKASAAHGGND